MNFTIYVKSVCEIEPLIQFNINNQFYNSYPKENETLVVLNYTKYYGFCLNPLVYSLIDLYTNDVPDPTKI